MPRSKHSDDIEFGSDSFLDVVANIVGILIILIVVAGIKAGQAAVSPERVAEFLKKHAAPAQPSAAVSAPVSPTPRVIPASPELLHKVESLRQELTALSPGRSAAAQIEQAAHAKLESKTQIANLQAALGAQTRELTREEQTLADAQSRLEQQKTGLLQLEVDVRQAESQKSPVKTIKHHLTPLSREIQGKEIHFRLLDNRVAYLPITELMEQLRPQMRSHRDKLIRTGIQHGEVGPIAGFRMSYVVETQHLSVLDQLQRGAGVMFGVTQWKLVPEPDFDSETGDEALKDGSEFLRYLRMADADTTITFWVYPDSFGLYRRLQEIAHQENFTVAARPLPFNVPIAGSPRGSRSSGQ